MCELFALSASQRVTLRYEMDLFAAEGGERHQNRHGWGIMFAEGRDAHLYREAAPASDSLLDRFVREHEGPSRYVIAHVRRASRGNKKLANTHPFRRIRTGHAHHFAHNGTLGAIEGVPDAQELRKECLGDTDSELAFLILLQRLAEFAPDIANLDKRFEVFTEFARQMAGLGTANFLFYDSHALYVYADQRIWETESGPTSPQPPGLHILQPGPGAVGDPHSFAAGKLDEIPDRLVLFASVPLNDTGWVPLPQGTSMAVRAGRVIARNNLADAISGSA